MQKFTTRPELQGTFGVVASTHWMASAVAMSMLERGGNAFDAVVAGGFLHHIVEPHLNGPAGDLTALYHDVNTGETKALCGQGVSPAAATIEKYRSLGLDIIPGTGLLSAVVPGAFDAWLTLLRDHGTMEFKDIIEPAIKYAEEGAPMLPTACGIIDKVRELFEKEWKTSAAIYLQHGVPKPGDLFRNPDLAKTYRRLVKAAGSAKTREARIDNVRRAWYEGFVAEAIDRFCREEKVLDSSGGRHSGLLTADDIAQWRANSEEPAFFDYHGYRLCKTGPWGQGPVALQQLALLKGYDLSGLSESDPEFVHLVVECAKLAFADREKYYGDPDFIEVPMERLLSEEYNDERRRLISDSASHELRPGDIPGYGADPVIRLAKDFPDALLERGAGEPTVARFDTLSDDPDANDGDTCHINVIDRWGNMVSVTPSGGWLQASPVIPELGFPLNTRAQMFWLEEGKPSSLAPGKRPRTTLTPSLVLREGKPYMVYGTPGGDQQDQWSLNVFLRHIHFGLNLQESIDAPEFHTTHFPGSFYPRVSNPGRLVIEGRFPKATRDELLRRGHDLTVDADWCLGRVCASTRTGDVLKSAANPRLMQGYAAGR